MTRKCTSSSLDVTTIVHIHEANVSLRRAGCCLNHCRATRDFMASRRARSSRDLRAHVERELPLKRDHPRPGCIRLFCACGRFLARCSPISASVTDSRGSTGVAHAPCVLQAPPTVSRTELSSSAQLWSATRGGPTSRWLCSISRLLVELYEGAEHTEPGMERGRGGKTPADMADRGKR
ncbi:hypothetical protein BD626DRAFT_504470 [Schizophyllum amplum]|uniref:Uncharacterized protein n=1 Tax=Schizophyllum amplum TaxID=97359 RepID=A0A550C6Y5_9AGAR|nr:hypothetical protein BD626DRAFT_504470 [Auriculariopsis ampla]